MNLKNERILKLWNKGLSVEQITKKLGLSTPDRVILGLKYMKIEIKEEKINE